MAHPVTWFQISAPDAKPLVPFYKRVFGWRMQPSPGQADFQIIDKESDGIAGGLGASANGLSNVTVYVSCDDVAAQLRKIEAAGGKTAMAPMELPDNMGVIGGFHDPAGNWVGLWAQGTGNEPTPAKRAPVKKAPAKKEPAKKEPAKKEPAKKAPAKKAPAKKAPAKKASAKKVPAKKAPAGKAPAKRAPAKKAPARKAPARKAPARKAPAKRGPAKKAPAKRASAKKRRR